MKPIPIFMHHTLEDIPKYTMPSGFHFRFYEREDDLGNWARIVTATKEFANETEAIGRFKKEFLPFKDQLFKRVIFIETKDGETIGTATAWFGMWQKEELGRLHWVEILPDYQGQGLGKPLISKTMELLAQHHNKAYLKTQDTSEAAIHIYQKFGWKIV
ncbi:GNAT family N-acetyltransferase [Lederbergia galactosidilytica]|uniref:N-acetyltransferase domain-containing protein n=1 Tax=Lederbergia galactosidilytica TaxID=217031 RepID=A0A177ZGX6_9BACI|nr:GNAT family N-acetyltransferase [Lederbergia galactosidilytica]KRG15371.1 hypothetical protein ACA30_07040 [Virgibacillus soli]MBP1915804.1 GNAT superfamily N-acetyltransferase [Lederbergia galactosidilytica]OAK67172.1 hypothetical protein ABB05_21720 [Lederbergia galactosidilytica]